MALYLSFSSGTEKCEIDQGGHFTAQEGLEAPEVLFRDLHRKQIELLLSQAC